MAIVFLGTRVRVRDSGPEPWDGAESPSGEQGAVTGQADPEPPEPLPWPRAPGVSNCNQPSLV